MSALARAKATAAAKEAKTRAVLDKVDANVKGDEAAVKQMMADEKTSQQQRLRVPSDYAKAGPLAPCLASWKNAATEVQLLLTTDAWEFTILGTIVFAGVLVGVQTFPGYEDDPLISWLDLIVLAIFTVEVCLKIFSEGFQPWRYWCGENWHWNNFDFIVVALCMPFVPVGSYVSVLRLARLARLIKIVDKVPQLKMIVLGMLGGMRAIFFICCLLFLVFYLYGIAGIVLFEDNDPWHFSNFADSMTTLYRMSTMEDWSDIMYINYYGCDQYHSGIYHNATEKPRAGWNVMESAICKNPVARPFTSALFCISFEVISGLVMFSMFIGAVSLSMTSSIDEINETQTNMRRAKRLKEEKKRLADRLSGKVKDVAEIIAPEEYARQRKLAEVLGEVWDGADGSSKGSKKSGGLLSGDERMEGVNPLGKAYLITVADPVRAFTRSALFTTVLLSVIIVACILVGFQTDPRIKDDPDVLPILHKLDRAATGVFVVECVLKIIAEGLKPWRYFAVGENIFDFFIVVGSFAFDSGLFILLRLVRLFRVLKLVKSVPELKMHVTALIKGVQSIGYIGTIMFIFFYVFGIVAWMLFKDNDPWHFSNILHSMLTLFRCATFEDWTDVMYINKFGCDRYGYMDFPDDCVAPYAWGGYAVLYCMAFETIGSLVLLNLFIGVITASMDESADDLKKDQAMDNRIAEIKAECGLSPKAVASFKMVFDMLDLDKSKSIEAEELRAALDAIGKNPSDAELAQLYAEADNAGDGNIDMADFILFMHNASKVQGGFSEAHVALKRSNTQMPADSIVQGARPAKGGKGGAKFVL